MKIAEPTTTNLSHLRSFDSSRSGQVSSEWRRGAGTTWLRAFALSVCAWILIPALILKADSRPNILFLFADDQRADTIAALGNPHIETPHIDRLVERGFRFERNYCMGSNQGAVCQPSRAMLLSGRSLYRAPEDLSGVQTLPEVLAGVGYATFGTGKWHNGKESFIRGFRYGTASLQTGMCDHTQCPVWDLSSDGARLINPRYAKKFSSELFADATIDFLREHAKARSEIPFFAYVAFTAPHDPRQPPPAYREKYYKKNLPLPKNYKAQHPFNNGWMTGRDEALAAWPRTPQVIRDQLAEYYGLVTHLDEQVGRIITALEQTGLSDNTVIVYSADHGLAVGSHGLLGKQNVYEHSTACPLIFVGNGIPAGGSSKALTYLFDLFPTLAGIAAAPVAEGVEGVDLLPLMKGTQQKVRDTLFTLFKKEQRAVRDDRYKLIRYTHINKTQLFDLEKDPHELHDLSAAEEHSDRIAEMMGWIERWQSLVSDTVPLTAESPQNETIDLTGRVRHYDRYQPSWIVEKYFPGQPAHSENERKLEGERKIFGK